MAGGVWGLHLPMSPPHPPCSASAAAPRDAALIPGTSKAAQAAREPAELCHHGPSCSLRDLARSGQKPQHLPAHGTAGEPTAQGWAPSSALAQGLTPAVNHPGEERTDTHCDHGQLAPQVTLDRSQSPSAAQITICLPAPTASSTSIGRSLALSSSLDLTQS